MKTINVDRELVKLGRTLTGSSREVLALLLMAGDESVLRSAVAQLSPARAAELAGAFATLATLPEYPQVPGLLPRIRAVTSALREVAPGSGLAAFDLGGLLNVGGEALGGLASGGGVIGDVLGGLGGVFNVLGGPALSPIVSIIGAAIGGNEPNLPAHDYNASNQQALAAAAARTLWVQQQQQQQQALAQQQARSAGSRDNSGLILIGIAAVAGAAFLGSSRSSGRRRR